MGPFWRTCNHDWHETVTREEEVFEYNGIDDDISHPTFTYIYCPKCDLRKKMHRNEWEILKREQEIKRKYRVNMK